MVLFPDYDYEVVESLNHEHHNQHYFDPLHNITIFYDDNMEDEDHIDDK